MLELKNIYKKYATKKGVEVHALKDVSIVFGQTGLVFVTGKSGSGKSTLLNLIGGLDIYDSGDIIINNKSSNDFKQRDFDSYRNTMVGFIFQEYNILDEFNVAQNIGLALALQGQKVDDESVNKLLKDLDIEGLGQRNPNELSGGQKQRVAIARALVKNPKIILADEPTGALDSTTGTQLIETLKKLSKDRLVIVISHDLEFARKYADRMIHFIDGKIDYDITYTGKTVEENEPIKITNEGILIKPKYQLTPNDLEIINNYLKDKDNLTSIKLNKSSKFHDGFESTDESLINKSTEEFELIKSKLPLKASFSMELNALSHKKLRLIFSIILSSIALIMFGVVDTFSNYDARNKSYQSVIDNGHETIVLGYAKKSGGDWVYYNREIMNNNQKLLLESKYENQTFLPIYEDIGLFYSSFIDAKHDDMTYYDYDGLRQYIEADKEFLDNTNYELIGELPSNLEEVVIPMYLFEQFKTYGYIDESDNKFEIDTPEDIIGKTISSSYFEFTISGVMDYKYDLSKYETLKNHPRNESISGNLYWEFREFMDKSPAGLFILGKGITQKVNEFQSKNTSSVLIHTSLTNNVFFSYINKISELNLSDIVTFKDLSVNDKTPLDIVVDQNTMEYITNQIMGLDIKHDIGLNYVLSNYYDEATALLDIYYPQYANLESIPVEFKQDIIYLSLGSQVLTQDDQKLISALSIKYYLDNFEPITYTMNINMVNNGNDVIYEEFRVIGYSSDASRSTFYVSDTKFDEIVVKPDAKYFSLITPTKTLTKKNFYQMIEENMDKSQDYRFEVMDADVNYLVFLSENIYSMQTFFFYTALIMASFAGLLMFSFMSSSVAYKKQEIGILRAIGASSKDVLGVFSKETLMISLINLMISIIGTIIVSDLLNKTMIQSLNLKTTLFDFGIKQIILLMIISLSIGFISSALPVLKTANKKPIDAIKNK